MILNTRTETNSRKCISKFGKVFYKPVKRLVCEIKCDHCGIEFERFGHDISPKRRTNNYSHYCKECFGQSAIKGQISRRINLDKMIGEKIIDHSGYPAIYVGKNYPYSKDYGGRIREHVVVMETHLKRALVHTGIRDGNSEVVHLIDGDKTNNKLSNLQVMTQTDHNRCHAKNDALVMEMYRKGLVGYNRKTRRYFLK